MSDRAILTLLLFLAITTFPTRRAAACHEGTTEILDLAQFPTLAVDAVAMTLTIHDLAVRHSSRIYAGVETAVMGLAAVGYGGFFVWSLGTVTCEGGTYPRDEDGYSGSLAFTALWSAALTAHGIYELVTERKMPVAPTVVGDGEHTGAGVAWVGSF